jgi:hypothetical protein
MYLLAVVESNHKMRSSRRPCANPAGLCVVLLLVLLMWRPAGALPSSTAGSTRSDCDELSVIGAPAPRSLLLVDVRSSTVLDGAYKPAFRYGPHKYPNASLEVSTGTSHDWWYERYDPVPVIGGLSGYLWRCRFAWQFTTGPPAPDAHTSLASRCAADASILLAATQAQPFSPSSATASTRCDALRTSDPNSVLRDQAVSVLNNETWWSMPVDHPRLVPIAVHANVTTAGLVDMSRNRTRGVAIVCHSTISCPTVSAVASDDTSQPFARRSNVLFNAMPIFDQYTATSSEGTPPTLTGFSTLLSCTWHMGPCHSKRSAGVLQRVDVSACRGYSPVSRYCSSAQSERTTLTSVTGCDRVAWNVRRRDGSRSDTVGPAATALRQRVLQLAR